MEFDASREVRQMTEEDGHGKYLGGRDHRWRAQGTQRHPEKTSQS